MKKLNVRNRTKRCTPVDKGLGAKSVVYGVVNQPPGTMLPTPNYSLVP
ncbi:hypothetical protein [Spirosoma aerolatum]|nr:hypothetical protein [Spirosoma aerolatum]